MCGNVVYAKQSVYTYLAYLPSVPLPLTLGSTLTAHRQSQSLEPPITGETVTPTADTLVAVIVSPSEQVDAEEVRIRRKEMRKELVANIAGVGIF